MRFWADLLTASRLVLAAIIVGLGIVQGEGAFGVVIYLLVLGWSSDTLDGHLARRDSSGRQTWFSRNDVTVDAILVVSGLLYLSLAGFVPWVFSLAYLTVAGLLLLLFHSRSLAIALELPPGLLPVVVAFAERTSLGWVVVGWLVFTFILDHRRFLVRLRLFINGWHRRRSDRQSVTPSGLPHPPEQVAPVGASSGKESRP